jgi:hypothetical protein
MIQHNLEAFAPSRDQTPSKAISAYNNLKESSVALSRSTLHSQDMNRYIKNRIIPKGLQVNITCATIGENSPLLAKWKDTQAQASLTLMGILLEHYDSECALFSNQQDANRRCLYKELDYDQQRYLSLTQKITNEVSTASTQLASRKNFKYQRACEPSGTTNQPTPQEHIARPKQRERQPKRKRSNSNPKRRPQYSQSRPTRGAPKPRQTRREDNTSLEKAVDAEEQRIITRILSILRENNSGNASSNNNTPTDMDTTTDMINNLNHLILNDTHEIYQFTNAPLGIAPTMCLNKDNRNHYLSSTVLNISDTELNEYECEVLTKGLNYCPTPGECNLKEIHQDLHSFFRRLRLKEFFHDMTPDDTITPIVPHQQQAFLKNFRLKSSWLPPPTDKVLEGFISAVDNGFAKMKPLAPSNHNLSQKQLQALQGLKTNPHIIIKKADKGSAVTVMNTLDYVREGYRQLSNTDYYTELASDPTPDFNIQVQNLIDKMHYKGFIDDKVYRSLANTAPKTPHFYLLPKIHKNGVPGRPILSANGCPTEKISALVDCHLHPHVSKLQSYVRDTKQFIQIIESIDNIPPNSFLVSFDVVSLYTNIPHQDSLKSAAKVLQ